MAPSVLLLGSTGFLGGTVLTDLEADETKFDVTVLIRPGNSSLFKGRRAEIVEGSYKDSKFVEDLAARHDVVINAATSDDLELTKAINQGLVTGKQKGKEGVLVHVSGTQLIESKPTGEYEEVKKFNDANIEDIKGISDTALHRLIDLEVVRADLAREIRASIICPGTIYGKGTGPSKVISGQIPNWVKLAVEHRRSIYAGKGTNVWPNVHVEDVSDLVLRSLKHNLKPSGPAGFARFYFAENGEHEVLNLVKHIGTYLTSTDPPYVDTPEPLSVPVDAPNAPIWPNKTTCQCVSERSRKELEWAPKKDLWSGLKEEIIWTAEQLKGQK